MIDVKKRIEWKLEDTWTEKEILRFAIALVLEVLESKEARDVINKYNDPTIPVDFLRTKFKGVL